jgi:lysophospholipase L1-like esterase
MLWAEETPMKTTLPAALLIAAAALVSLHEGAKIGHDKTVAGFAQRDRYQAGGQAATVLIGDSITEFWTGPHFPSGATNRGIAGQTSSQVLVRFQKDVVDLHPSTVVIAVGTNDLALGVGLAQLEENWTSMAELATAHRIRPVFGSLLPSAKDQGGRTVDGIRAANQWLREYCRANGFDFVDYYSAVATTEGRMPSGLSSDGLHPNQAGYELMRVALNREGSTK